MPDQTQTRNVLDVVFERGTRPAAIREWVGGDFLAFGRQLDGSVSLTIGDVGRGEEFVAGELTAYPPGSVVGEYVTQVSAIGPLGLEYVNAADDPRRRV